MWLQEKGHVKVVEGEMHHCIVISENNKFRKTVIENCTPEFFRASSQIIRIKPLFSVFHKKGVAKQLNCQSQWPATGGWDEMRIWEYSSEFVPHLVNENDCNANVSCSLPYNLFLFCQCDLSANGHFNSRDIHLIKLFIRLNSSNIICSPVTE